ncbi:hypothetical protein MBLNU459_g7581t4 [Dothideomycetes sp. NU459]
MAGITEADAVSRFCTPTGVDLSNTHQERIRKQALARYFTPAKITRDAISSVTPLPVPPTLSSTVQLTGLAQLGTLRLDCDRAFISLIDCKTQYIIAEATRSVSLRQSQRYASPQDALYLGVQALEKDFGVCPNTIGFFTDAHNVGLVDTHIVSADNERCIIRDFRELDRFKHRPYVVGFPHMRFYAEVPLKDPGGQIVGSFCVVDTKPRYDFGHDGIFVLKEISEAIVDYLELVSVRHNQERGERLMEGLRLFTDGKSGFPVLKRGASVDIQEHQQEPLNTTNPTGRSRGKECFLTDSNVNLVVDDESDSEASKNQPSTESSSSSVLSSATDIFTPTAATMVTRSSSVTTSSDAQISDPHDRLRSSSVTTTSDAQISDPYDRLDGGPERHAPLNSSNDDDSAGVPQGVGVSAVVGAAFSRAAGLIRESMDIESLVLFDACLNGFSSWVDRSDDQDESERSRDDSTDIDAYDHLERDEEDASSLSCPVLGRSQSPNLPQRRVTLPEATLKRLLKMYPEGHIFQADEFGALEKSPPGSVMSQSSGPHKVKRSSRQISIHSELVALLPAYRSIIFLPLWDFQRERWFAGMIGGTSDPTRSFEREDLTCLSAFGNSLVLEMARLEALEVSRAKSDFISSVSHELRSPLHGILASAELLREELGTDPYNNSLVDMIESCGNTLLDTMNHLLDFAKINNLASQTPRRKGSSQEHQDSTSVNDLALLVQDVIEGVYLGHHSSTATHRKAGHEDCAAAKTALSDGAVLPQSTTSGCAATCNDGHVAVLIDIDERPDWKVPLNAGAWKRIVMNLFANSMKYTVRGHIEVSLKRITQTDQSGVAQDYACFVISDTGIGMNAEYLKHRIFTPFAQENPLAVGTGLGLSIVKQIVANIGGQIEVQSEVGIGTRVRVLAPLAANPVVEPPASPAQPIQSLDKAEELRGRTLCLVSLDCPIDGHHPAGSLSTEAKRLLAIKPLITKIASDWFGMKVTSAKSLYETSSDYYLALTSYLETAAPESPVDNTGKNHFSAKKLAVLALDSAWKDRSRHLVINGRAVTRIQYPIGPRTLGIALVAALKGKQTDFSPIPQHGLEITDSKTETSPVGSSPIPLPEQKRGIAPVSPEQQLDLPAPKKQKREIAPASPEQQLDLPAPKKHVLLVDDNAINLRILTTYMKKLDCTFITARNGLEALERYKASENRIDIVFMDISMPIMNGFESSRGIREFEAKSLAHQTNPTRIIALTGLGSSDSRKEATSSGIDDFRVKPVPMKDLKDILDSD